MSAEIIHKAVVTQFISEVFGEFSGEHMPALLTEDFHAHAWASHGIPDGSQHIRQVLTLLRATFRNPRVTIQDLLAQGDRVAARYLFEAGYVGEVGGVDVTGKRIRLPGMLIARMRGEKIAECWWEEDRLTMLAQVRAA
jgi:predicted ester cyclase